MRVRMQRVEERVEGVELGVGRMSVQGLQAINAFSAREVGVGGDA